MMLGANRLSAPPIGLGLNASHPRIGHGLYPQITVIQTVSGAAGGATTMPQAAPPPEPEPEPESEPDDMTTPATTTPPI